MTSPMNLHSLLIVFLWENGVETKSFVKFSSDFNKGCALYILSHNFFLEKLKIKNFQNNK